jgi:hypothetical protein
MDLPNEDTPPLVRTRSAPRSRLGDRLARELHRQRLRSRRHPGGRTRTIKWAGRLIVFYGAAHTLGALTVLGAARHAGAWFSGELWGDDLADMSPANSALWLSVDSFGVPLIVVGLMVLWLDRRGITPPPFVAWTLGVWTVIDAAILLLTPWPILLVANALLLVGNHRARQPDQRAAAPSEYVGV